jgi:uncharacterized protein YndB with AHSA1/START domain
MENWAWIAAVAGGLLTPILLAVAIGSLLPKNHRTSRSVVIRQSPQTLWAAISNLERLPSWWLMIRSVELLPAHNGTRRFRQTFANRRGRDRAVEMEVAESEGPRRLVTRIADPRSPLQGQWTHAIEPVEGGCRITVIEEGSVTRPLVRFFFRTMMSRTAFVDGYLRALGQRFGEQVRPS